jgi:hypothetical protein
MSSRTMQHGNLRMSLPDGWSDATQIVAVGPMEKGFRSSLAVSSEPAAPREGLAQHAARVLPMLVSEGPATFGTQNGFLREYRHVARGAKLAQLQFYVLSGGLVHTFTYTQLAERMTVSRATAERLFASVFLGDAPVATPMSPRIRPKGVHFRFMRSIAA